MVYLKCLSILGIVIMSALCNNDTTTVATLETTVRNVSLTTTCTVRAVENITTVTKASNTSISRVISGEKSNVTKHFVLREKTRAVLIINHPPTSALRQRQRKKKRSRGSGSGHDRKAKVESLLYEEYDADGSKLVEYMMYDLEAVSTFFATYLHTEICHVRCEPRPEDIAREEAKKANSKK